MATDSTLAPRGAEGSNTFDPELHHRRSIRLRGHDYAGGGAYFVTICTQAKECLFGQITEEKMMLSDAGHIVEQIWWTLPQRFKPLVLDAFQIMPNHLHAVFVLPGAGLEPGLATATGVPVVEPNSGARRGTLKSVSGDKAVTSMADVVRVFKSICSIRINALLSRTGTRLLQRNFYEHVIRNFWELEVIRDYIVHNPQRWLQDPENPNMAR